MIRSRDAVEKKTAVQIAYSKTPSNNRRRSESFANQRFHVLPPPPASRHLGCDADVIYLPASQEYSPNTMADRRHVTSTDLPFASNVNDWPKGVRTMDVMV